MRALVMLFAVGAMGTAVADPTADAALVHLERGVAAFRAGEFARAHRELSVAHELAPDRPNPYRWLALTEIQLGDCAHALIDIDGFLTRVPADDARVPEMTRWRELCTRTPNVNLKISETPGQRSALDAGLAAPSAPTPVTKRWWFWPVVGGAALTVIGGIVYAASRQSDPLLPSVTCDPTGCAP